jgi:Ca2+-dependent lipid-binding protein
MTVKPITTHGLDVAVLPGIAGWLDKLLSVAFEQTLVEPNMLVVDMEKFVSPESGGNYCRRCSQSMTSILYFFLLVPQTS